MNIKGALLINLGTPDQLTVRAIRRYLRQFLMDPLVIDIPYLARWLLVHAIIAPLRAPRSLAAYQQIWTSAGSPLLVHGLQLEQKVQQQLGDGYCVRLGMRYGNPSLAKVLQEFHHRGVRSLKVIPLYPQFAQSSFGSSIHAVKKICQRQKYHFHLDFSAPFYDRPCFIDAFVQQAMPLLQQKKPDHVLFSYHGLPERHLYKENAAQNICLTTPDCCDQIQQNNQNCYRAQCLATTRKLAERLGLQSANYTMTFQSRLGRTPWIRPYTDEVLRQLPRKGIRNLLVLSPSFVADCLETLEEIAIRGKETFIEHGGQDLQLVPSLNASSQWVNCVCDLVR